MLFYFGESGKFEVESRKLKVERGSLKSYFKWLAIGVFKIIKSIKLKMFSFITD